MILMRIIAHGIVGQNGCGMYVCMCVGDQLDDICSVQEEEINRTLDQV